MSIETVSNYKVTDEEVIVHPTVLKKGDTLKVDARVVIVIEVDGIEYEYNKVQTLFVPKSKEK